MSSGTGKVKLAVLDASSTASAERLKKDYPCKARCHACCFRMVRLTIAEAMVIYSYLVEIGQWGEVHDLTVDQLKISKNVDPTAWFKMRIECPILDRTTKLCRAYKVRPPFCSTHFVKSSPEVCDPWYVGSEKYESDYMEKIFEKAMIRIGESIQGNGILGMELPIQSALLLAERVSIKSGLSFEQILKIISNEF